MDNKAFNMAKYPKYDRYQRDFASMVYKFFDKKNSSSGIKNDNILKKRPLELVTQELAEELHKPIIRKFF